MEKNTTDSQKKRILRYLLNGNSLTPLDALNLFGCFRLGARIWELRNEGYPVKMRLIEQSGKRFAEYYFFDWEVALLKDRYDRGCIKF